MERLKTMAILALLVALAGSIALAATVETEVRINARQLEDGRVEFALQQRVDGEWGERILPPSRYLPADVGHNRWLNSTAMTLDVEVEYSTCPQVSTPPATTTAARSINVSGTSDAAKHVTLTNETWQVVTTGTARYSGCSLWIERSGGYLRGIEEIRPSSSRGTQTYVITVGAGYSADTEPGLIAVDPIGCSAWSASFTRIGN